MRVQPDNSSIADSPDARVARIASHQHGMITTRQLRAAGLSPDAITWRVRHGRLHRVHHGVYFVGHGAPHEDARRMGAALSAGAGAAIAGLTAAAAWRISRWSGRRIEVVVPRRVRRASGFAVRFDPGLRAFEVTRRNRIPITTIPRTIFDLGRVLEPQPLASVVREAAFRHGTRPASVRRVLERHPTKRWHGVVVEALAIYEHGGAGTRSDLEDRFAVIVHDACPELGLAVVNEPLIIEGARVEADLRWPAHGLCVEVDGRHDLSPTRREDALRDALLRGAGYRIVRITAQQVEHLERLPLERRRREIRRLLGV